MLNSLSDAALVDLYLHLRLAGIAVVKLRINILHLIVLLLAGNCKRNRQ